MDDNQTVQRLIKILEKHPQCTFDLRPRGWSGSYVLGSQYIAALKKELENEK